MAASLQTKGLAMPVDQVADSAVLDHHTLGQTGGAGGVDHVSQVRGVEPCHLRVFQALRPFRPVEGDDRCSRFRHTARQGLLGQYHFGCAVGQQIGNALVRVRRIDRDVACACLEDGEHGHQRVQAATGHDRHAIINTYAETDKVMGQCVGTMVHLAVVQAMFAHLSRYTFRCAGCPGFDHGMHRLLVMNLQRRRVERFQQVTAFLFADQRDAIKMRLLISRQGFEDLHEIAEIPLHGHFVEQRRGVVQRTDQRLAMLAQVQRKVEFGHLTDLPDQLHSQVAQRRGGVFAGHPVQRVLEQRGMGQAARRTNHFHDLLERQVLMFLCFQYARLDLG